MKHKQKITQGKKMKDLSKPIIAIKFFLVFIIMSSFASAEETGNGMFSALALDDMNVIAQTQPQMPKFQYSDCAKNFKGKTALPGGDSEGEQLCWLASPWSSCSNGCGEGTKSRNLKCVSIDGVESSECTETPPSSSLSCVNYSGCNSWTVSAWSTCAGDVQGQEGVQVRTVSCASGNDEDCNQGEKPESTQTCVVPYELYASCELALSANTNSGIYKVGTEEDNSLTYCDGSATVTWIETKNYCFGGDAIVSSDFTCKVNGSTQAESVCIGYGIVKPEKRYNCYYDSYQTTNADFSFDRKSSTVSIHETETYFRSISGCKSGCNGYYSQYIMKSSTSNNIGQSAQRVSITFYESYDYGGAYYVYLNNEGGPRIGIGNGNTKRARTWSGSFYNYGLLTAMHLRIPDLTNSNYAYAYFPMIESCKLELIIK